MDSLTQDENKLYQNSISYLHNISSLSSTLPTLKCLYLTKSRLMELRKNIHVTSNASGTTGRCKRCLLMLIDGPASYRIKAEEKKSQFARKLLAKKTRDKPMTKYQRKYMKRLDAFSGNKLGITCKYCKKESFIKLEKPKKPKVDKTVMSKRKRKIKKKDKFCGLKKDVVLSVTPPKSKTPSNTPQLEKKAGDHPHKKKNTSFPRIDRNFDTSEFIPLEINDKWSKFKPSKKNHEEPVKEIVPKVSIRESQSKLKKKSKLKEFLSTAVPNRQSPSSNLKHFLQGL